MLKKNFSIAIVALFTSALFMSALFAPFDVGAESRYHGVKIQKRGGSATESEAPQTRQAQFHNEGETRIGNITDAPEVDAEDSQNLQMNFNGDAKTSQDMVEAAHKARMEELKREYEALQSIKGTARTKAEREAVYETADRCLEKMEEAETREEREFWRNARNETLSQLPQEDDATAPGESRSLWYWALWIGTPIVILAGAITAVVLYRRRNEEDPDEEDDEDDEEEAASNGAQVHIP